jgi:plastocyanin
MSRRILLGAAACIAAAAVPAGAFAGAHAAGTHVVTLFNTEFHPAKLTIHRGDRVKWVWREQTEHNVTFHGFHSRTQESGSYTVRFTHAGTFNYRCTIHAEQGMRGKIIVR